MKHNTSTLVADIGGTYARFTNFKHSSEKLTNTQTYLCSDYEEFEHALNEYLVHQDIQQLDGICIAAAGPIINGNINVTNNKWKIFSAKLKKTYHTENVKLLNDFEAIAYSLPQLTNKQLVPICKINHPLQNEHFTYGLLGPGSGLGVAGLCSRENRHFTIVTEAGHVGFSPVTQLQLEILSILKNKFNRVSNEQLISGPGLVNIYDALCEINAVQTMPHTPATIFAAANESSDPVAKKAVYMFFDVLGQVAGDIALSLGAYDGIYISGGIAQRYPELLLKSSFYEGFTNKGCHQHLLEKTPIWLITDKNPGLLGASLYIKNLMAS